MNSYKNVEEFLKSKGIELKSTALISHIDGAMRQPDLAALMQEYAKLMQEYANHCAENKSDGYHTFNELYAHRNELFFKLCQSIHEGDNFILIWKSKKHIDGTSAGEGWFVMGIHNEMGKQITYHMPMEYWDKADFAIEFEKAFYDGHTSDDVLKRLGSLDVS